MTDINIDQLVHTAVFGDGDAKAEARRTIHLAARQRGAVSSSIYPLYMAFGRNEIERAFTVPAFNIRALTYDAARALFRVAMKHDVGAFIFEIARSEIGYTEQRPGEYAACVLAAAIREGFKGPVFIQGDHFQASAKKWATEEGQKAEMKALESLIDEALAAEFYNIDIDTSTLVDLDFPTRDEQQRANYEGTAHLTKYIREREPNGITVSVGGEIGEVGKYNTHPEEVRAYADGLKRLLGGITGISKISVQTGTSHGGVPLADGSIAQAKIDFEVLRETTHICREEYGMAGAVQHGASTLPESVFNKFPEAEAVEIHLATGFQNMILDAPTLPQDIKDGIRDYCFEHCLDERKPEQTDEQFVYTTRKKALGPFKRRMWEMDDANKGPIIDELEAKFAFLMEKLGVHNTKDIVARYVKATSTDLPEYAAASAELTAAAVVDANEGE
ncbi:MAG: class II fructose-bisphosphate aldolase [Acidobacteria bacterium]|nr:class II fructose-bisphosphate aldolase [Acidobacteriota bacterium]MBV9185129.1 class II fructose-bisphosphate aldolase [Acidobacteriota bacterium]